MVPQQSEDQPSLLGNAREPPHLEGVIHVTGAIMASGIKDVAVRAPDGSMGQIDSVRNDQLGQQGIAPGFENMPVAGPTNENVNRIANDGPGNVRDESQRDYVNQKDTEQKAKDQAVDEDEYPDDKDNENRAQQPDEVSTLYLTLNISETAKHTAIVAMECVYETIFEHLRMVPFSIIQISRS